jgi:redox-sensitive bicupin YhaK (pirin superfamily)
VTDPEFLDVTVPPGSAFSHPTTPGHTVIAYVIDGQGCFAGAGEAMAVKVEPASYFDLDKPAFFGDRTVILFEDGDHVRVTTGEAPVRFLLISGRPLGEPVAWQGPIVMNTEAELRTAFREYRDGTFIKHAQAG